MRASGVWPTLLWVNLSAVHSGPSSSRNQDICDSDFGFILENQGILREAERPRSSRVEGRNAETLAASHRRRRKTGSVKPISRSQWNDGYGADFGRSLRRSL